MVEKIRVSAGTASILGLDRRNFKIHPSTCYLMTYRDGKCFANCAFCPQARDASSSGELLSRVSWPVYSLSEMLSKLKNLKKSNQIDRICLQTLNYSNFITDLYEIVTKIKQVTEIPISIALPPVNKASLIELKNLGVDRVGIALDCASSELFDEIKGRKANGPYRWEKHLETMKIALSIFPNHVSTHLIVGVGENEKEMIHIMDYLNQLKIIISLFAFTPIKGTRLAQRKPPSLISFRKIQLSRFLIVNEKATEDDFQFDLTGNIIKINISRDELKKLIETGIPFLTSGCPGCNRPFYTSRPSGPIYNYPRTLTNYEKEEILIELEQFVIL